MSVILIQNMQMMFTHEELLRAFRKGLRNGNWRKLSRLKKALYMASLWYSRVKGAIINEQLVGKLSVLVDKLEATSGARIFKRWFEKAVELLSKGEESGVFAWAPSLKEWLKDPDYIFWLGAMGSRSRITIWKRGFTCEKEIKVYFFRFEGKWRILGSLWFR